jgi:hypothetical protein
VFPTFQQDPCTTCRRVGDPCVWQLACDTHFMIIYYSRGEEIRFDLNTKQVSSYLSCYIKGVESNNKNCTGTFRPIFQIFRICLALSGITGRPDTGCNGPPLQIFCYNNHSLGYLTLKNFKPEFQSDKVFKIQIFTGHYNVDSFGHN